MSIKPIVLCVDDLPENLRIRAMLLNQFGYETVTATDRQSALHAMEARHIDLLLIDYHLARGETGEEIALDARALQPGLRIIMLTGDARIPDSARDCVDEVMIKGQGGPSALLDMIQKLLPEFKIRSRCARPIPDPKREAS